MVSDLKQYNSYSWQRRKRADIHGVGRLRCRSDKRSQKVEQSALFYVRTVAVLPRQPIQNTLPCALRILRP